jgi:hypothetical protein
VHLVQPVLEPLAQIEQFVLLPQAFVELEECQFRYTIVLMEVCRCHYKTDFVGQLFELFVPLFVLSLLLVEPVLGPH